MADHCTCSNTTKVSCLLRATLVSLQQHTSECAYPKADWSKQSKLSPQALTRSFPERIQMAWTFETNTGNKLLRNETVLAASHASQQSLLPDECDLVLNSMLPLFYNQAKSVAMIRHSMDIVKTAVQILNQDYACDSHCMWPVHVVLLLLYCM